MGDIKKAEGTGISSTLKIKYQELFGHIPSINPLPFSIIRGSFFVIFSSMTLKVTVVIRIIRNTFSATIHLAKNRSENWEIPYDIRVLKIKVGRFSTMNKKIHPELADVIPDVFIFY